VIVGDLDDETELDAIPWMQEDLSYTSGSLDRASQPFVHHFFPASTISLLFQAPRSHLLGNVLSTPDLYVSNAL
jgi:hypothetical protein